MIAISKPFRSLDVATLYSRFQGKRLVDAEMGDLSLRLFAGVDLQQVTALDTQPEFTA